LLNKFFFLGGASGWARSLVGPTGQSTLKTERGAAVLKDDFEIFFCEVKSTVRRGRISLAPGKRDRRVMVGQELDRERRRSFGSF